LEGFSKFVNRLWQQVTIIWSLWVCDRLEKDTVEQVSLKFVCDIDRSGKAGNTRWSVKIGD